jgi:hypothetical protein
MRLPWKLIGLAAVAGAAATGMVTARRRAHRTGPGERPARLHGRLGAVSSNGDQAERTSTSR